MRQAFILSRAQKRAVVAASRAPGILDDILVFLGVAASLASAFASSATETAITKVAAILLARELTTNTEALTRRGTGCWNMDLEKFNGVYLPSKLFPRLIDIGDKIERNGNTAIGRWENDFEEVWAKFINQMQEGIAMVLFNRQKISNKRAGAVRGKARQRARFWNAS